MNYTRKELKNVAQDTVCKSTIMNLEKNTKRFTYRYTQEVNSNDRIDTEVIISPTDTFLAAKEVIEEKPLVLNMASWKYPGGSFLYGCGTQEEDLCRRSTLYWHIKDERYPFNHNEVLYTPEVCVFKGSRMENYRILDKSEQMIFSVATIPAICMSPAEKKFDKNTAQLMRGQIDTLFSCAEKYGHNTLVLGAWGCGAFNCSAREVASMFKESINKWKPKKVVFAILPLSNSGFTNYKIFWNEFMDGDTLMTGTATPSKMKKKTRAGERYN